ncbi:hypothetical protein LCGC14_2321910 [marine sediment metagenome]|uniref:Transcriptional regulator MraZ n=1 Tax=marine sediment metagenome TaxID=412755 RepID=A0A0F9CI65_9ZZZZ
MITGCHNTNIDKDYRVKLNRKVVSALVDTYGKFEILKIKVFAYDKCLIVPIQQRDFEALRHFREELHKSNEVFFETVMVDEHGLLLLSKRLKNYAGLRVGSRVIILGMLKYIEIWSAVRFEQYLKNSKEKFKEAVDEIGKNISK